VYGGGGDGGGGDGGGGDGLGGGGDGGGGDGGGALGGAWVTRTTTFPTRVGGPPEAQAVTATDELASAVEQLAAQSE
jgi:hypothetical protein